MVTFKEFLESSTIHGLFHISNSKRYSRFFWIFVVILGFSGSIFLIVQAFNNWDLDPIKTTIETKPIFHLKLPNITVCPPKDTFTNLNYDLMMMENVNLSSETRLEIEKNARQELQTSYFEMIKRNLGKLIEENRYFNWYHGYSRISLPWYAKDDNDPILTYENNIEEREGNDFEKQFRGHKYAIETSATSGLIKTQYFGERYDMTKIERKLFYIIRIFIPTHVLNNEDYTLTVEVDSVHMLVQGKSIDKQAKIFKNREMHWVDKGDREVFNITGPKNKYMYFRLMRDVTVQDLKRNTKIKKMPGFQVKWYYNQVVEPDYLTNWKIMKWDCNSRSKIKNQKGKRNGPFSITFYFLGLSKTFNNLVMKALSF